ncbi:hypothetical protein AB1K54_06235 [Microbacterium sp. BWT-B31]|uniref:hypothetical protein n=1 Tax=Microbacterium sp. BWT-B31 TaxID=3232072 RepID=UPI0035297B0F
MKADLMPTFAAWLADPVGPLPLPDRHRRRVRGSGEMASPMGWPAALIAPCIVDLVADRGVTYRYGKGLAIDGVPVLQRAVISICVDVMRASADTLEDDYNLTDEARGLRLTADDVETSRAASGNLLDALRPLLPETPLGDLAAFFDDCRDRGFIARSDLTVAYLAAGAPGNLTRTALYAQTATHYRQTARRGIRGFDTRTAAQLSTPAPGSLEAALAALVADHGAAAVSDALAAILKDSA